jgi:lipoprotein-releasing system ATP-binding protein
MSSDTETPILVLDGIRRSFAQGNARLEVLHGASLSVWRGEMVALVGPSGCGKSTLLHIAGLLEQPDGGEVRIAGQAAGRLPDARRTEIRRKTVGFVYQYHHLLREFSALENVLLPQMIAGQSRSAARKRAEMLLAMVGLAQRAQHRPAELSGGEQQRVALALALAQEADVLLLDEPTSHLDPSQAQAVLDLVEAIRRERGLTVVAVFHDVNLAALYAGRLLVLHQGAFLAGGLPEDVLRAEVLDRVYGPCLRFVPHPDNGLPQVLPIGGARDPDR